MKSLKTAIIALCSVIVFASCESESIAPSASHSDAIIVENIDFAPVEVVDQGIATAASQEDKGDKLHKERYSENGSAGSGQGIN